MNATQARQILRCYRPHGAEAVDPEAEVVEALAMMAGDPELQRWFSQHQAVEQALRAKIRELPVPVHLRDAIRAHHRRMAARPPVSEAGAQDGVSLPGGTVRRGARPDPRRTAAEAGRRGATITRLPPMPWWRHPVTWAAAAAVMILASALSWWQTSSWRIPDQFADFRSRMVRTVLREYRMDIRTNDMAQVRRFLGEHGGPADYVVPERLQQMHLTGAGLLRWRNHPVSMICFDRGDQEMLFLFVLERGALKDAPPEVPQVSAVSKLVTASWTEGSRAYLLAGPPDFFAPGSRKDRAPPGA